MTLAQAALVFTLTAGADEATTIHGIRSGQLHEIGPLRSTPVRLAVKGALLPVYLKYQKKNKVVRYAIPAIFTVVTVNNIRLMRKR